MHRLKKVLYFTIGEIVFPFLFGFFNAIIWKNNGFEYFYKYFFVSLYHLLFPVSSAISGKMVEKFPNRYAFYGMLYFGFEVLGILLFLI